MANEAFYTSKVMPIQQNGADSEWSDGEQATSQTQPNRSVTPSAASPASPQAPGNSGAGWKFPPNASRDDCLRIKISVEKELKLNPKNEAAMEVLAEAHERLRYFTPSGQLVPRPVIAKLDAERNLNEPEFPLDVTEARQLHGKMKREKVKTIPQRDAKRKLLSRLGAHIAKLESGLPTITITANDQAKMYANRDAGMKRTKLEMLARQIPEVKALLADYDALVMAHAELLSANGDLLAMNDSLGKENAELRPLQKV